MIERIDLTFFTFKAPFPFDFIYGPFQRGFNAFDVHFRLKKLAESRTTVLYKIDNWLGFSQEED